MATTSRVGSPARYREWGLTVDHLVNPTQYIVLRYRNEARRHAEPYEILIRVPYKFDPAVLTGPTGMPEGTAMVLINAVEAKRASPKAADADQAYRPAV